MTINLYIGDTDSELAKEVLAVDPQAFLIDRANYKEFLTCPPDNATVYTSLGDLPNNYNCIKILDLADTITYCPPVKWSSSTIQDYTEYLLSSFAKFKNNVNSFSVVSQKDKKYLKLAETRKTEQIQLWISGCSYSDGIGVTHQERYGQLLANQLNLPVAFLTFSGSSIAWAADQILRSDIRANDIIVWGLTSENRFPYWNKDTQQVEHILPTNKSTCTIKKFISHKLLVNEEECIYKAVTHVQQVINFCNKIHAKLLIIGLLPSTTLSFLLHNNKEYFSQPYELMDRGADNQHPGPKQHQAYADFCQSALKKLNYI